MGIKNNKKMDFLSIIPPPYFRLIIVVLTMAMLSNNRVLCVVTQATLYTGVDTYLATG